MPQKTISLRIDGELVKVAEGESILQAARASGKTIPSLCFLEGITPVGACRLCVVEVAGMNRLLPACTTPAQEGMAVITTSPRLTQYRRMVVELILAERNHICAVCVSNGHCELQSAATALGVTSVRYAYNYPRLPVDLSQQRYVLDHNRCILCTRCVRVCAELEGAHVWDVAGRGIHARIVSDLDLAWGKSTTCTNCGKCVQACPTGALSDKGRCVEEMVKHGERLSALAQQKGAPS